jgi:predicted RNase H-like HicB family nuclease
LYLHLISTRILQPKMKKIKMKKEFTVIIEQDEERYFVAEVPELPGCHTQAKSMDDLLERTREAISLCLEVYKGRRTRTHLVGVQRIAL